MSIQVSATDVVSIDVNGYYIRIIPSLNRISENIIQALGIRWTTADGLAGVYWVHVDGINHNFHSFNQLIHMCKHKGVAIPAVLHKYIYPLTTKHDDLPKENAIMTTKLIPTNEPLTMSSLEIAELCDKEHRNVMRDIKNMLEQLEIGALSFEHTYTNPQNGQQYRCFNLNKELSLTLVAGYNVKLRHKIIQRWQELENGATPQVGYDNALKLLGVPEPIVPAIAQVYEERDNLKKTKAQISDKKTATAMATAANLSIENKKLKAQLEKSKGYATILAIQSRLSGVSPNGRKLANYCRKMGLEIRSVDDVRFGRVNSYPAQAWQDVYNVNINQVLGV